MYPYALRKRDRLAKKKTNKWRDGYTDAQTVHHINEGKSDYMHEAL